MGNDMKSELVINIIGIGNKRKRTNYKRYEKKSHYCFKPDEIEKPF